MESARRPISAVPLVGFAQEVVEDLGVAAVVPPPSRGVPVLLVDDRLDAPGDVDEGALRGVTHGLLTVDDLEHGLQQLALGPGEFTEIRIGLVEGAETSAGFAPACSRRARTGSTSWVKNRISWSWAAMRCCRYAVRRARYARVRLLTGHSDWPWRPDRRRRGDGSGPCQPSAGADHRDRSCHASAPKPSGAAGVARDLRADLARRTAYLQQRIAAHDQESCLHPRGAARRARPAARRRESGGGSPHPPREPIRISVNPGPSASC